MLCLCYVDVIYYYTNVLLPFTLIFSFLLLFCCCGVVHVTDCVLVSCINDCTDIHDVFTYVSQLVVEYVCVCVCVYVCMYVFVCDSVICTCNINTLVWLIS